MKIKVTRRQFEILVNNLQWIEGLSLVMTGKTFKRIILKSHTLKESRMFSVELWFGASQTTTIVTAHNSAHAVDIVRKMFPDANVHFATPIKV